MNTPSPATQPTEPPNSFWLTLFQKLVMVETAELKPLLLGFFYFFFLMAGYFILRPIRDEIGVASGVNNLPWLFTGTLLATLAVNPIFSFLVVKFPAKKFITISYRFAALNLAVFFLLLKFLPHQYNIRVGIVFFIWTSVFNLFVVSVFWAVMADGFRHDQAKRLFAFIGAGGTLGGLFGVKLTELLVQKIGTMYLLLLSALFIEIAVQFVGRFVVRPDTKLKWPGAGDGENDEIPIGGRVLAGITQTFRSPYLLGICAYMLLFTIGSTVLYFNQADIVGKAFADRASRTAFLARIEFYVQAATILTQFLLTQRIIKFLGLTTTLALVPAVSMVGFLGLGLWPTVAVLVAFQTVRRAGNFAVGGPSREILYTVIKREDKYKAKSFIDTCVYRTGDQIGAWTYAFLSTQGLSVPWASTPIKIGLSLTGISFIAAPLSALWLGIGLWLGYKNRSLAEAKREISFSAETSPAKPALVIGH